MKNDANRKVVLPRKRPKKLPLFFAKTRFFWMLSHFFLMESYTKLQLMFFWFYWCNYQLNGIKIEEVMRHNMIECHYRQKRHKICTRFIKNLIFQGVRCTQICGNNLKCVQDTSRKKTTGVPKIPQGGGSKTISGPWTMKLSSNF